MPPNDSLDRVVDEAAATLKRRQTEPYDGILGDPPEWLPEHWKVRFSSDRSAVLDSGVHPKQARQWVEHMSRYLAVAHRSMRAALSKRELQSINAAAQRIPAIPPRLRLSISSLALIRYAETLGKDHGLQALAGKEGADGRKLNEARRLAGKKTAERAKIRGAETRRKALAEYDRLERYQHPERDRAAKVAAKLGISIAHARKLRKETRMS